MIHENQYENYFDDLRISDLSESKKSSKDTKKKSKKKKKNKQKDEYKDYDYSEIHYDADELISCMKKMADALECYKDYIETYAIFEGITEDEWNKNMAIMKKLIKKLRKGDPSVFDIDSLNEVLDTDHQLVLGLYS